MNLIQGHLELRLKGLTIFLLKLLGAVILYLATTSSALSQKVEELLFTEKTALIYLACRMMRRVDLFR